MPFKFLNGIEQKRIEKKRTARIADRLNLHLPKSVFPFTITTIPSRPAVAPVQPWIRQRTRDLHLGAGQIAHKWRVMAL